MQGGMGGQNPLARQQQSQTLQQLLGRGQNPLQRQQMPGMGMGMQGRTMLGANPGMAPGMGGGRPDAFGPFSGSMGVAQGAGGVGSGVMPGMGGGRPDAFGPFNGTMGSSTGGGGVGYAPGAMPGIGGGRPDNFGPSPTMMGSAQGEGGMPRTGGSFTQTADGGMSAGFPSSMPSAQPQMPDFGNWLNDYRQRQGDGFTGTRGGMNFINGNLYAAEGLSQGTDPNSPSFAFGNILRQYAPQIQQLGQLGGGQPQPNPLQRAPMIRRFG